MAKRVSSDKYIVCMYHKKSGAKVDLECAASQLSITVLVAKLQKPSTRKIKITQEDIALSLSRGLDKRVTRARHDLHQRALNAGKTKPTAFGSMTETEYKLIWTETEYKLILTDTQLRDLLEYKISVAYDEAQRQIKDAENAIEQATKRLKTLSNAKKVWKTNKSLVTYHDN